MAIDRILIRLDAGEKFGLGHLSRCVSLIQEFQCAVSIFIIKSDNQRLVKEYLETNLYTPFQLLFLDIEMDQRDEIDFISARYTSNTLLIVDHYEATAGYQQQLYDNKIRWLQLDSHAKESFYADWVVHGSPGATKELYEPLRINPETRFLLGPRYCIIKKQILSNSSQRRIRSELKNIFICFGGGNDHGATLQCLTSLDFEQFDNIEFNVAVNRFNSDYGNILAYQDKGLIKIIEPTELIDIMCLSDLAIIAPGMMSYESVFLGLPMLLVTIADNQIINAQAWEDKGCALKVGGPNDIPININKQLRRSIDSLSKMSMNCLTVVDGKGVERIINEIRQ